jgi:hypothetical protein
MAGNINQVNEHVHQEIVEVNDRRYENNPRLKMLIAKIKLLSKEIVPAPPNGLCELLPIKTINKFCI